MCIWARDLAPEPSLCGLNQIRVRSSDRIDGRASLSPATVCLDIAAGWKVNSEKDSECTPAPEKPETRGLSWCQASQKVISGLGSVLWFTSLGVKLRRIGGDC